MVQILMLKNKKTTEEIYLKMALNLSELSKSWRKKVGCLIVDHSVSPPQIISDGVNGTFPGDSLSCETVEGKTADYVIHAEVNALKKLKRIPSKNCVLYVTFQPCLSCAKEIVRSGIKKVVYLYSYKEFRGNDFLLKNGVSCIQVSNKPSPKPSYRIDYSGYLREKGLSEKEINEKIIETMKTGEYKLLED